MKYTIEWAREKAAQAWGTLRTSRAEFDAFVADEFAEILLKEILQAIDEVVGTKMEERKTMTDIRVWEAALEAFQEEIKPLKNIMIRCSQFEDVVMELKEAQKGNKGYEAGHKAGMVEATKIFLQPCIRKIDKEKEGEAMTDSNIIYTAHIGDLISGILYADGWIILTDRLVKPGQVTYISPQSRIQLENF